MNDVLLTVVVTKFDLIVAVASAIGYFLGYMNQKFYIRVRRKTSNRKTRN